MPNQVPEPLSVKDWKALFQKTLDVDSPPSFEDIYKLARLSPALHLAFEREDQRFNWRMNEENVKHFLAQQLEYAHGIKLHHLSQTELERIDTYQEVENAIVAADDSSVHFDALLIACGRILDAGIELHPQLKFWLGHYLLNRLERPPSKRGPDPYPNLERNTFIIHFLKHVDLLRFPITENEASFKGASACHAIHDAFDGHFDIPSVKRLMNIWSDRRSQR